MRWKRAAVLAAMLGCVLPMTASAVCRVVEPSEESGGQGVLFDPETTVLVVKSPDQIVDYECPEEALLGDGGPPLGTRGPERVSRRTDSRDSDPGTTWSTLPYNPRSTRWEATPD